MGNYPKELEDLLQDCLTDGIITPQERQVLLRKAESMGVDPAEYDLHITNEEQKLEQANRAAAAKVKGRACPYCGSNIPQLADKCPSCNKAISVQADSELEEVIDHLEEALIEFKSGKDFDKSKANVERYIRKAEMYYGNNPKIQVLLEQVKKESELAEAKAKKKAIWNTIGKILTYNKWLTAGVILALIIGISSLVSSIKGPDPSTNPQACIEKVNEALAHDDPQKASALITGYKHSKYDIHAAFESMADYYISKQNWPEAEAYIEDINILKRDSYYAKMADAYIEYQDYDKAIGLLSSKLNGSKGDPYKMTLAKEFIKKGEYEVIDRLYPPSEWGHDNGNRVIVYKLVIDNMKSRGKNNEEIKKYIDSVVPNFGMDESSYSTEERLPNIERAHKKYKNLLYTYANL